MQIMGMMQQMGALMKQISEKQPRTVEMMDTK